MSAQLFFPPYAPVFGLSGLPAGAARVSFFYTGTTTFAPIYADVGLVTPIANPVATNALGRLPSIYLDTSISYRVRVLDVLGAQIDPDIDPYIPGTIVPGISGPAGKDGINGAAGSNIGAIGPKAASSGMILPSGLQMVRTSCYAVSGDGGEADYAMVGMTDPGTPASSKFQDSLGRWWLIVLPSGQGLIEQFGGRGDSVWNGSTLTANTDNYQPILDAFATLTSVTQSSQFATGPQVLGRRGGSYAMSQTLNLHKIVSLESTGTGTDNFNNECRFFWLGDMDGIVVNGSNTHGTITVPVGTYGSASGSRIKGISLFNPTVQSRNCHALRVRTRCTIEDIYGQWLSPTYGGGNVVYAVAQSGAGGALEGNISGAIFRNISGRAGARVFEIGDKDANVCEIGPIQCVDSGLGGFYEHGTLGNSVSGLQVNQCNQAADSGYARGSNGQVYMLISDTAGVGGTNDPTLGNVDPSNGLPYWESQEIWPGFPAVTAWVSGKTYTYSPAIGLKGISVTTEIGASYTESYVCDMSGSSASQEGGTINWTRNSANAEVRGGRRSALGYGYRVRLPYGGTGWTGDPFESDFRGGIGRDWQNGEVENWGYSADQKNALPKRRYEYQGDTITAEALREYSRITGRYTQTKDGPAPTFYTTIISKLMLRDLNTGNQVGLFYSYGIPTYGTFGHGARIINSHYVAGTPSQWTVSAANGGSLSNVAWAGSTSYYDYGNIVKNGGNCYINVNSPARQANHTYAAGDMFSSRGKDYKVTTAGTTSASGPIPDGFGSSITDGTCVVQFMNGSTTASSGGPTGTSTSTPVRDGDVWWLYSPDAALVAGPNF